MAGIQDKRMKRGEGPPRPFEGGDRGGHGFIAAFFAVWGKQPSRLDLCYFIELLPEAPHSGSITNYESTLSESSLHMAETS